MPAVPAGTPLSLSRQTKVSLKSSGVVCGVFSMLTRSPAPAA
jgi:hypothetical protein